MPQHSCADFPSNVYKWAVGQMGTRTNEHLGEKGTPRALGSFPQNVYKWAPRQMGTWEKMYFKCPNRVPQVPYAHFPQMLTNGQWSKWTLRANGHLEKKGTPSSLKEYPKCPGPISPKCSQMGNEANGHLG